MLLGPSSIINLAQLVSLSVALPAELVLVLKASKTTKMKYKINSFLIQGVSGAYQDFNLNKTTVESSKLGKTLSTSLSLV